MVRKLCALNGFDLEALADEEMLSWNEARSLARDPLVSIGAHTHDHHALARLPEAEAESDIRRGSSGSRTSWAAGPPSWPIPMAQPKRQVCARRRLPQGQGSGQG
ncbi:hypothetical protein V6L77_20640 [Pannonibacter sp. Pt2-lr]